jgi:hypothetical protein
VPKSRYLHNVPCLQLLAVAEEMLAGEIAYRRGDRDAAFARLRAAVALEDDLPFDEPWGWMQPVRHALGALLCPPPYLMQSDRPSGAAWPKVARCQVVRCAPFGSVTFVSSNRDIFLSSVNYVTHSTDFLSYFFNERGCITRPRSAKAIDIVVCI